MDRSECWGQLTHIDLFDCDRELLLSEAKLTEFSLALCEKIKMKPHGKPIVDRFGEGDLFGLSAVQFIETSTITTHLDDQGGRAFIDVFSCKKFDENIAVNFCKNFYRAREVKFNTVMRGEVKKLQMVPLVVGRIRNR